MRPEGFSAVVSERLAHRLRRAVGCRSSRSRSQKLECACLRRTRSRGQRRRRFRTHRRAHTSFAEARDAHGNPRPTRCLVLGLSVEDEQFDATCASPREVDGLSAVQSLSCEAELPARLADSDERDHVERISVAPGSDTAGKRDPRSVLAVESEAGAHRRGSRSSERAARDDDNEQRQRTCACPDYRPYARPATRAPRARAIRARGAGRLRVDFDVEDLGERSTRQPQARRAVTSPPAPGSPPSRGTDASNPLRRVGPTLSERAAR